MIKSWKATPNEPMNSSLTLTNSLLILRPKSFNGCATSLLSFTFPADNELEKVILTITLLVVMNNSTFDDRIKLWHTWVACSKWVLDAVCPSVCQVLPLSVPVPIKGFTIRRKKIIMPFRLVWFCLILIYHQWTANIFLWFWYNQMILT